MAEEEYIVSLQTEFYRDNFGLIVLVIVSVCLTIALTAAMSVFIYLNEPPPITFPVDIDWRVQAPVPVEDPYLSTPDLLQWVGDVIPKVFVYDFEHYDNQLKAASQYFTDDGWKVFLNQLNIYANYTNVQSYKLFVNGDLSGAPFILNQGILTDLGKKYAWWVQIPIEINYAGTHPPAGKLVNLQVLVVRVPTVDNLIGVAIDNVMIDNGALGRTGNQ